MTQLDSARLREIFKSYPEVRLVYVFGSQAVGNTGPLSDYDLAVFLDERAGTRHIFDVRFELQDRLSCALQTDKLDVVILNLTQGPEFQYDVIKNGQLIYEVEPYRLIVEPTILNTYFDFIYSLRKHDLTRA